MAERWVSVTRTNDKAAVWINMAMCISMVPLRELNPQMIAPQDKEGETALVFPGQVIIVDQPVSTIRRGPH